MLSTPHLPKHEQANACSSLAGQNHLSSDKTAAQNGTKNKPTTAQKAYNKRGRGCPQEDPKEPNLVFVGVALPSAN